MTLRLPGPGAEMGVGEPQEFLEFVKTCFAQKRKTLANNLRALAEPNQVRALLEDLKIRVDARAEQLDVSQFVAVYPRYFFSEASRRSG